MEAAIAEKHLELKDLDAWKKKLKKDAQSVDKSGKLPKTTEACDAKLKKLKEHISQKEFELTNKQENAEVALGTSKINYMDPRITITWSKQHEVPIERVFPKTLRSKFAWAMEIEPEWKF